MKQRRKERQNCTATGQRAIALQKPVRKAKRHRSTQFDGANNQLSRCNVINIGKC